MVTEKSWLAKDIKVANKIMIIRHKSEFTGQDVITITRNYSYVDDSGEAVPELIRKRIAKDYVWENLPQDMKDLLAKLDEITRAEALEDAGME